MAAAWSSTCTSPPLIPELEQFAMNAGRSPQRVGAADLADQIPHVSGYAGSAVGAGFSLGRCWPRPIS
jgi:hypothetical protein